MYISHFFFLLMTLLAVYFVFTLDYGNDVRQEANWSGFLFEFKMGHKAAETTRNINTAFGPGTANKHTMQWLIKSFAKENRDLKMRSTGSAIRS